jgi:chromosome segregation ATPase
MSMDQADREVLGKFAYVLRPDIVDGAIADAVAELRTPADLDQMRETLTTDLRTVTAELDRYAAANATAGDVAVLAKAVAEREQRRQRLQQELAQLNGVAKASTTDTARVEKALRAKLKTDARRCWSRRRSAVSCC